MGAAVHFEATGAGEPALLFVHGFGCTHEDWRLQVAALAPRFRCIALDLPGHGASPPTEPTIAALAAAVNAAKAQSGDRRVVLVGHSLGCKVIREAYCADATGVVGMAFIEGAYYDDRREALLQRATDAIDAEGFPAFAQRHFAAMFVPGTDPALRDRVLARVRQLDPGFARALYLDAVGWDPLRGKETLAQIRVPVLVLQSTYNDALLKRMPLQPGMQTPFMATVRSLVPRSDIEVIPGCGHFSLLEAPDSVNRALAAFAERINQSQP